MFRAIREWHNPSLKTQRKLSCLRKCVNFQPFKDHTGAIITDIHSDINPYFKDDKAIIDEVFSLFDQDMTLSSMRSNVDRLILWDRIPLYIIRLNPKSNSRDLLIDIGRYRRERDL